MGNFGKREKIILVVMAIAILYAAFEFLSPKSKSSPTVTAQKAMEQKNEELKQFVAGLNAGLDKEWMKNVGALIFSRAERPWAQDPFLENAPYKAWLKANEAVKASPVAPAKINFIYSGYIELGQKKMAIINGMEYREGDPLDIAGYALKNVNAARAVIENLRTGVTENVPLQD